MGFRKIHPVQCQAITVCILHFLVGRNQSFPNFAVHCKTRFKVEFCDLESTASILLEQHYHFHYKISVQWN